MSGVGHRQRSISIAALVVAALLVAGLATWPSAPARAQGGACTQACQAAYAQCYKNSGSNRRVCDAQLQQCLSGCIAKR